MDEEPWKINPDRNQPRRYVLNSQDRLYCANKKCGSYREAILVSRIREDRIEQLPKRIQDLIDDIMIVEYSEEDFLDSNEWEDLWTRIIDVKQRARAITDENILPPVDCSDEVQFGFELGSTLSILRSNDSHVEPLLWGILQGLLSGSAEDARIQIMIIESIIERFKSRIQERRQRAQSKLSDENATNKLADDIRKKVNACLRSNDIEVSADELGIIDEFIGKVMHGGKYYNMDEDVKSYIDDRNLSAVDDLRKQLEEDSVIVENKSKQGVKVREILQYMYFESEGSGHRKDDFPFRPAIHHMLVAALKQLANRADGGLNMNRPVVEQVSDRWELTTYGKLLSYTVFEQADGTWVYTYSIDPHNLNMQQRKWIGEWITSR